MTVKEFADRFSLRVLSEGEDRTINGGFCGDLLSWVMANARMDNAWFTVMGNINAVAVASLNDVACIVLCQNSRIMDNALEKAKEEEIWVLSTERSCFDIAGELYVLLNNDR
ncbi:MAG: hypothetical protein IJG64_00655 [Oscillospiraceae bacterium]|nr:hypothetical protein [Oscillospiraceae bacterium]